MTKRLFILILIPMLISSGIINATATKANVNLNVNAMASQPSVQAPAAPSPVYNSPQQVSSQGLSSTPRRGGGRMPVIGGQATTGAVYSPQTLNGMTTPFAPSVGGFAEPSGATVSRGGNRASSDGGYNATGVVIPSVMFSSSKSRYSSNVASSQSEYPEATELSRQLANSDPQIPFPDPLGSEWVLLLLAGAAAMLRRKLKGSKK